MSTSRRRRVTTAAMAAVAALAMWWPAPVAAADPGNGRIAFTRDGDVFTINPAGGELRRVTQTAAHDEAVWSPAGTRLAVVRCRCDQMDAVPRLIVMRPDGSGVTRVSGRVFSSIQTPMWSPDGTAIAYVDLDITNAGLPGPYPGAVKVAKANGSGDRRLTGYGSWNGSPAWSPDGRWIAFTSHRDGDGEIYLMRPDGSRLTKLTDNDVNDGDPEWSPDGTRITFTSSRPAADSYTQWLRVMNTDGSGLVDVTPPDGQSSGRGWSPDGRWLLAERTEESAGEAPSRITVSVVAADGSSSRDVVTAEGVRDASWSPDGRRIMYTRGENIFLIAAAGGQPMKLARGTSPSWQRRLR